MLTFNQTCIVPPVNASQGEDIVRLFAMVGTSAFNPPTGLNDTSRVPNYYWNIKVQQVDCSVPNNPDKAPDGCLQYFTAPVGSIESFNYRMRSSPYPVSTNYAICIKRQGGEFGGGAFCGITFATGLVTKIFSISKIFNFH